MWAGVRRRSQNVKGLLLLCQQSNEAEQIQGLELHHPTCLWAACPTEQLPHLMHQNLNKQAHNQI